MMVTLENSILWDYIRGTTIGEIYKERKLSIKFVGKIVKEYNNMIA